MNSYLAEVVKKKSAKDVQAERLTIALNLLNEGVGTLEQIAKATGLALIEVTRLSRMLEGMNE